MPGATRFAVAVWGISTLVCVAVTFAGPPSDSSSPRAVYLLPAVELVEHSPTPLMLRELVRQAVLLSAREECGLNTRDAVLREFDPAAATAAAPADLAGAVAQVDTGFDSTAGSLQIRIHAAGVDNAVWDTELRLHNDESSKLDLLPAVEAEELASRQDYPAAWAKLGVRAAANSHTTGSAPLGIEPLLYDADPLMQFIVLQRTQTAIRKRGESPDRLGALVRAYANLGQLTRLQWSANNKVFAARSLLYAQRMVAAEPNSAFAYWHRAYALALAGLEGDALHDVEQAKKLGGGTDAPAWARLIEPFCKDDLQRLTELATAPSPPPAAPDQGDRSAGPSTAPSQGNALSPAQRQTSLASLLCYLDVENCGSVPCVLDMAGAGLSRNPGCMRILESAGREGGVGYQRWLSEVEFKWMLYWLPRELRRLQVVPQSTAAAIKAAAASHDQIQNLAAVAHSLVVATEPAEPSFTLAGRLVEEDDFLIAKRRAHTVNETLGLDASDEVATVMPLVRDHPYRRYIESFTTPWRERAMALRDFAVVDPQPAMFELIDLEDAVAAPPGTISGGLIYNAMFQRLDTVAFDLEDVLRPFLHHKTNLNSNLAPTLLAVSPYSAVGMAGMIRDNWEDAEPHVNAWLASVGPHPAVLGALAAKYVELGQPDKAEPLLRQYVAVAPDSWAYESLANIQLQRGDEGQWLSVLQQYLAQPAGDFGLDHSQVRIRIARHFLDAEQPQKALPFADAAAETESSQALVCDAQVHMAIGDAAGANRLMQSEIEHYDDDYNRYVWFRETGNGDAAAALAGGQRWFEHNCRHPDRDSNFARCITVSHLIGDPQVIRQDCDSGVIFDRDSLWILLQSLACQRLGDSKGRDDAVRHFAKDVKIYPSNNPDNVLPLQQLAQLMLDTGDKPLDPASVNRLAQQSSPSMRLNVLYLAARQHQLLGDTEQAKRWYAQVAAAALHERAASILATVALRDLQSAAAPTTDRW